MYPGIAQPGFFIPRVFLAEPRYRWKCTGASVLDLAKGLDKIWLTAIPEYTDLPIKDQLYINDIDLRAGFQPSFLRCAACLRDLDSEH
jgi:hypothetical protein